MTSYSLTETRRQLREVPHEFAAVVESVARVGSLHAGPVLLCGSGDSRAAAQIMAPLAARPVEVVHPWQLSTASVVPPPDAIVVLISASGHSDTTVEAARQLAAQPVRTVAVTGQPGSPLAQECDEVVAWRLGSAIQAPSPAVRTFVATHVALSALLGELPTCKTDWIARAQTALAAVVSRTEQLADWLVGDAPASPSYLGTGSDLGAAGFARAKSIEISGLAAVAADPDEWFHVDRHGARPFGPLVAGAGERVPPGHVRTALVAGLAQGRRVALVAPSTAPTHDGLALLPTGEIPTVLRPLGLALLGVAVGLRQAELLGRDPFVLRSVQS